MAFEENKHPRDKNGQFTSKGGGASTGSTKSKVDYDEDYERSWGPANDEEIEKIEIDGDYERAVGPAPDPEEFPEDYKKYISDYKKWLKNGESWDGLDGLKGEKNYDETIDDENKQNALKILKSVLTDEEYNQIRNNKNYIDGYLSGQYKPKDLKMSAKIQLEEKNNAKDTSKEDEEEERKQAYKLFNLPF